MNNRTIVILSVGKSTLVCINGKLYGEGIKELSFSHAAGELPHLSATVDRLPLDGNNNITDMENFVNAIKSVCMEGRRAASEE